MMINHAPLPIARDISEHFKHRISSKIKQKCRKLVVEVVIESPASKIKKIIEI